MMQCSGCLGYRNYKYQIKEQFQSGGRAVLAGVTAAGGDGVADFDREDVPPLESASPSGLASRLKFNKIRKRQQYDLGYETKLNSILSRHYFIGCQYC